MLLQKMSQPAKDPKTGKADAQTQMMGQMMFLMPVMFFWITLGLDGQWHAIWDGDDLGGYRTPQDIAAVRGLADAVLVGSSLAGSGDLARAARDLMTP